MNKPTPFGKTYKEYTEAVAKFNLNKVTRIELGLANDIKSTEDALEKALTELNASQKEAADIVEEVRTELDLASKALDRNYNDLEGKFKPVDGLENKAIDLLRTAEKLSKELGIDVNDIPGYRNLEDLVDNADGYKAAADDTLGAIAKLQANL